MKENRMIRLGSKKVIIIVKESIFNMLALLLLIAVEGLSFISCNKDDDINPSVDTSVQIVTPSREICDFFDREWTYLGDGCPQSFFQDFNQDICLMVNNEEDLRDLYQGNGQIPYIDFQQYTLVIGKKKYYTKEGEKNPTQYEGQKLYIMDGKLVLDLSCKYNVAGVSFYSDRFICFWGVYPKLSSNVITVNIQYVE